MIIILSNEFVTTIIKSFFKFSAMAVNFSSDSTLDKKSFYRRNVIMARTEDISNK